MLHALVVGIDAHADPKIRTLHCARRDAEALADVLRERVEDEHQVTLLVDEKATKERLERALTDELPRRVAPADVVLVYFAGFGAPDIDPPTGDPSVHLVLHDTSYERLFATAINVESELSAWLKRMPSRHVAVILDASFSGESGSGESGSGAPGSRTFEGPGLWSGPRMRRLERTSCARLAFGRHCAVLAACSDKELAVENVALGHGVFTHALLDVLRRPSLHGAAISLDKLHGLVVEEITAGAEPTSVPVLHGTACGSTIFHLAGRRVHPALSAP